MILEGAQTIFPMIRDGDTLVELLEFRDCSGVGDSRRSSGQLNMKMIPSFFLKTVVNHNIVIVIHTSSKY